MTSVTEQLVLPRLATGGARPLITHYDAAGNRVELSVATTVNWAAKTANWLRDEADVEPGSPVACLLPAHWQTLGILLGVWWCGGAVTTSTAGATVAFVPGGVSAEGAGMVAEVSLHPLGLGLTAVSGGAVDFVEDSRLCGDDFVSFEPVSGDTAALGGLSVSEVVGGARGRGVELGVVEGVRALFTGDWGVPDGVLDVLAVVADGGGVVQCDGGDLERVALVEKVGLRV